MKGKLPITEKIILESNEDQWRLKVKKLITDFKTSGIIEKEPGTKVRVQLTINEIIPPERVRWEKILSLKTDNHEEYTESLRKSLLFLYDSMLKTIWTFYGYIEGEQRIPIIIIYVESTNVGIYTQKLKSESTEHFFPPHLLN
ncbi:MAG: hypothetical protein AB1333_03060 [Patescibacteria group bacterium]